MAPKIRTAINEQTIQGDVVDILNNASKNKYPYFNSKMLIEFCSIKEIIPILQKIRKGDDYDKELGIKFEEFLEKKNIKIQDPFQMFKTFLQEIEERIIESCNPSEKLIHKKLRKIEENQLPKESQKNMQYQIKKMFEMMNNTKSEINTSISSDENTYFDEFLLKWPDEWRKVTKKELVIINQNVLETFKDNKMSNFNPNQTKLAIVRKKAKTELTPTINIGVRNVNFKTIDEMYDACESSHSKNNFVTSSFQINSEERSFTINYKMPASMFKRIKFTDDIYQLQKYFLRNDKEFVITITKINEDMLENNPNISNEIASMLQSFAIL